jgi:hypothetical protein
VQVLVIHGLRVVDVKLCHELGQVEHVAVGAAAAVEEVEVALVRELLADVAPGWQS